MLDNLVCPISNIRVDRNVVRLGGLLTTGLLVAYVLTRQAWIIVPVGLDYVLRAMMSGPASPMTHLARLLAQTLRLPHRAMDKAPKVFASRIGVCFAMGAAVTHFTAPEVAVWLAGTLAVFTLLESAGDFCVGCVIYTYGALPLYRARDAVMAIPLFRDLEDTMLASVAAGFQAVEFGAGDIILKEGDVGAEMFVIRSGEVEVFREAPDGSRTVVTTYKPRQFFGEMALLSGNPRNASVRATTPVTVLRLKREDLEGLFQKFPDMPGILQRTATRRLASEAGQPALA